MPIKVELIPVLEDNYIPIIIAENGNCLIVDPALAKPVDDFVNQNGLKPIGILNTHHHWDHTDGIEGLKSKYKIEVFGPKYDLYRVPSITNPLVNGDKLDLLNCTFEILEVPGHTLGHIVYYVKSENLAFVGDTLFAMGCGRLFEGSPEQMYKSLNQLVLWPDSTTIYCAHEYTESNGQFALSMEPDNTDLQLRMKQVEQIRSKGRPTIPTQMGVEKRTNPFLRVHSTEIKRNLGLSPETSNEATFTALRHAKDQF
tara:strand:- start:45992 stop:46759 length:768 start_codon:yes stop_codon:yes gene_type:complete